MFCETCDLVFCLMCVGGSHNSAGNNNLVEQLSISSPASNRNSIISYSSQASGSISDHTVIPLSVARKRMSEIVIYKANECSTKLTGANNIVTEEIDRLEHLSDAAFNSVNRLFEELGEILEKKRLEMIADVRRRKNEKRKVLEQQLAEIESQKSDINTNLSSVKHMELSFVTNRITELNSKLDCISQLSEPRENSYIEFNRKGNKSFESSFGALLKDVGRVKTSKTFPSLCRATMETAICNLETVATVQTFDYHGNIQDCGGDPISAEVITDKGSSIETEILDLDNGSYEIRFTPVNVGTYCLKVFIFARAIKDCPMFFDVTRHNSPLLSYGSHGSGDHGFIQPCSITLDMRNKIYVMDTGNSRIKVLDTNFELLEHVKCPQLEGRSVTGLCLGQNRDTLVSVNWRTRMVAEMTFDGVQVAAFTHKDMVEPIAVSVTPRGEFVVVDTSVGVLLFDQCGKLIRKIGRKLAGDKGQFKDVMSVCVTAAGEIVIADTRIVVFDMDGNYLREFGWKTLKEGCRGRYQGLTMDRNGLLLAVKSDKTGSYIQVFNFQEGTLHSVIDSHGARLKRPTGICVSPLGDRYAYIVDIGADCVRQFRYR